MYSGGKDGIERFSAQSRVGKAQQNTVGWGDLFGIYVLNEISRKIIS